jgi:DNA-binding MarR family transcriptional regulator
MNFPAPPTISQHLCYKLYSTSLQMTQLYKPLLSELKLTYPQYLVMVLLWEEQGIGLKDIAIRLGQDPGSITPLLKRLESVGYVIRSRNPLDERNKIVTLTNAGKELRMEAVRLSEKIVGFSRLTAEEAQSLMSLLDKLADNLAS